MAPFFGYHMPNFSFPEVPSEGLFDYITSLTRAAEAAGFDLVTVMDHFYQIRGVGPETEPMLEEARSLAERMPPDRLATAQPMVPEQAAEVLGDWMAAGAQGFTFRNPNLSTPELLDLAGELKQLVS